jgi:hypothetical protein
MADKAPQATAIGTDDDPTRGMPYHDKLTADLKALMARKRIIDNNVVSSSLALLFLSGRARMAFPHQELAEVTQRY